MADKKMKTVATLTPISPAREIDASGGHVGAVLGRLLMAQASINLAFTDQKSGVLDRETSLQYVRGLKDGGVLHAHILYDMLCKHDKVKIDYYEVEDK